MRLILIAIMIIFGGKAYAAPSGCTGNRIWFDENKDGVQQRNEQGLAGVEVTLVDESGSELDSVKTQSKGYFKVCGPPGAATLQVLIPEGYSATTPSIGKSRNTDSNIDAQGIASVVIVRSKMASHVDAGLIPTPVDIVPAESSEVSSDESSEVSSDESSEVSSDESSEVSSDESGESLPKNSEVNDHVIINRDELRYGVWIEARNAMPSSADSGVDPAFPLFDFAHVRGKSLAAVDGDSDHPEYVVNILNAARGTNTALDLQLGSSSDYGWNYATGRGNFSLSRWKSAVTGFANDSAANEAIRIALIDGTIRYIFLIDEPHHSRWSPGWNGNSSTSGNTNHVTNVDLDDMAAHVKSIWGSDVKTIVRAAPVRLIQQPRGGMYVFKHVTHAYLSPSPNKWIPGAAGDGKGFEWWLRQKNNHINGLTNCNSFAETGLEMAVMLQWGFESRGNPYNGSANWKSEWWAGNVQYPYKGKKSYVKAAPLEMDYIIKHFLIPRNLETCKPDDSGERLVDTIVSFRWDRLPTDNGKLPMSSYPHYQQFHSRLLADIASGNYVPHIGLPVGIGAR